MRRWGQALDAAGRFGSKAGIVAGTLLVLGTPVGCTSPLGSQPYRAGVSRTIADSIAKQVRTFDGTAGPQARMDAPTPTELELAERRDELDRLTPSIEGNRTPFTLGPDLTGAAQAEVALSLDDAIATAVMHNLVVQGVRFEPVIAGESVIAEEAVFDIESFASASLLRTDEPRADRTIDVGMGPIDVATASDTSEEFLFGGGITKRTYSGGQVTLSTDLSRFRDNSPGTTLAPDPAYTASVRVGVAHQLMRGFGSSVNRAGIDLAANAESRAMEDLVTSLLVLTQDTEVAYWQLALEWRRLEIFQWLVDEGVDVRDALDKRRDFDVALADYSDSVARVEARKADVIRARRDVRAASDALKLLLNDPELSVGSEVVLRASDPFATKTLEFDVREIILNALRNRPEIDQAMLVMDDAVIGEMLADNARLPILNVSAEVAWTGMDDQSGDAYSNTFDADFIDYLVAALFEWPLGNREAEAEYSRSRLRRAQSLIAYRQSVQNVVADVKAALRDVVTSFELISAARSARVANAEDLRALLVEEETLAGLTPEFLDLKFTRQDSLALARARELAAIAGYDQSRAALSRAMGTALEERDIEVEVFGGTTDARP